MHDDSPLPKLDPLDAADDLGAALLDSHGFLSDEDDPKPVLPEILNVLPLRESVIYPMLIAPLSVSRPSSLAAIDDALLHHDRLIGVLTQRDPLNETPDLNDLYEVGCAVIIRTSVKMPDAMRLIVQGTSRFRVLEVLQTEPSMRVRIEPIPEPEIPAGKEDEVEALRRSIATMFEQAVMLSPVLPDDLKSLTTAVEEPQVMADLVTAHLQLPTEDKQKVLETVPLLDRQRLLLSLLAREVRVLELSSKVQSEVNFELSKSQREYYLREQMKAIQRELGEWDDREEELSDLRERLYGVGMPPSALTEAQREFDRLRRMNPSAPEHTVARTYLETLAAMPWQVSTEDHFDLEMADFRLNQRHSGLEKVKERILDLLAVRIIKTDGPVRQPILCLVGPPGVGKTSLGKTIAEAMDRKFVRASLGGMRDEAEIRGHRRTYVGAMPGQIVQGIKRVGVNNPVFILDEIDKLASDFRGDPASALLEALDPEQNNAFRDHYMDVAFDLSKVFFIATANRLDTIPSALRDRMEVIEIGSYTAEEKFEIAKRHLAPKQIAEHGLSKSKLVFEDAALRTIVAHYTREAGVRNLEREIATVVRKATRKFAAGRKSRLTVNDRFVEEALGAPYYQLEEIAEREMKPGMAIGLAWTPVGGDVLFVETVRMPNKTMAVTVTGQLGDVMRESVTTAMNFLRANAVALKLDVSSLNESEIHVHVPAGAVPKDGPSAGVTMLTALYGLLSVQTPRPRLAMTGEITLTGQVLPVGGIKEKVLAAYRAGVREVLLPADNQKDFIQDVPELVRQALVVHFVRNAEEVLAHAFCA